MVSLCIIQPFFSPQMSFTMQLEVITDVEIQNETALESVETDAEVESQEPAHDDEEQDDEEQDDEEQDDEEQDDEEQDDEEQDEPSEEAPEEA